MPPTGNRFTCTSMGDRKMLICCQSSGGKSRTSWCSGNQHAAVGRRQHGPGSAGHVPCPGRERRRGKRRRGSRTAKPATAPKASPPMMLRATAAPMNGQPAGSIRTGERYIKSQVTSQKSQRTWHKSQSTLHKLEATSPVHSGLWLVTWALCLVTCDLSRATSAAVPLQVVAGHLLHAILQRELPLLQVDFFNLFDG